MILFQIKSPFKGGLILECVFDFVMLYQINEITILNLV